MWLDAESAPAQNAGEILEWNFDKQCLVEVERAGVPLVPTIYIARGDTTSDIVELGGAPTAVE